MHKKEILKKFRKGNFQFASVGKEFKLIEENTKTVFVPKEEEAQKILGQIKIKGITKELVRQMGQYCVNVYENIAHNIKRRQNDGQLDTETRGILTSMSMYQMRN